MSGRTTRDEGVPVEGIKRKKKGERYDFINSQSITGACNGALENRGFLPERLRQKLRHHEKERTISEWHTGKKKGAEFFCTTQRPVG